MAFNEHNQQLADAIAKIIADSDILNQVVHGDENLVITVDTGEIRSLRNILNLENVIENTLLHGTSSFGIPTADGDVESNVNVNVTGDISSTGEISADSLDITTAATLLAATITTLTSTTGNITTVNCTDVNASGDVDADGVTANTLTVDQTATVGGNAVLTTADTGSGNGLDADTVDGIEGSSLARTDTANTFLVNQKVNPTTGATEFEIVSENNEAILKIRAKIAANGNPKIEFYRAGTGGANIVMEATGNSELTITGVDADNFLLGANKILTSANFPKATQALQEVAASTDDIVTPENQKYHPTAAKAWVNFTSTGTIAINSSYNILSLNDNATGDWTVNFTDDMGDTDFVCLATGAESSTGHASLVWEDSVNRAVGSVRIKSQVEPQTADDPDEINVVIFGNLA